jgi:hypothetical protein
MKLFLIDGEPFKAEDLEAVIVHINERLPILQEHNSKMGKPPISEVIVCEVGPENVLKVVGSHVEKGE